ncbi:MAG TPA: methyltransferase domain-containing protein [Aquabacterium sp.]|uniref:methyltransferase domain-containing protein n=1 Tax=Aquabacterium sp. TaxID=1872578 RepID=UPI002E372734|nr:methyltransferase domain-containing protein [Aquabacterium sp.]HEX5358067.1 methyltransferase domain-containing protein [Aquabacterium sp.]
MKSRNQPHIFAARPAAPRPTGSSQLERQIAITLYHQSNFTELERYARDLSTRYPNDGFGWKLLGAALQQLGRTSEALWPMQQAASLAPMDWEAFNNLGSTHRAMGNMAYADACYRRAIELKPDFAEAISNLAEVVRGQGNQAEALTLFQRLLELRPDDGYAQHMVDMRRNHTTPQAPALYVTKVFNDYADNFDKHLQGELHYEVPAHLTELIQAHAAPPAEKWDVLDLGCGTGLVAASIAPLTRKLVGVDLSSRMLDKARSRSLYQRLECAEIHSMLQAEPEASYDLITCADVFIYIGKLDELIGQARRVLRPQGLLAFSIEALSNDDGQTDSATDDTPYRLERTGRYSQSPAYMSALAQGHGFEIVAMQPTVLRLEGATPVKGYLGLWRR